MTKSAFINKVYTLFLHIIPALIIDFFILCVGKKPRYVIQFESQKNMSLINFQSSFRHRLLKTYKKIHKFSNVISFFCTNEWIFTNDNVQTLWNNLNADDREIFFFDITPLNWTEYISYYMKGMRMYLFKDDLSNVEVARKKWRR